MKRCPTCNQTYADEQVYCTNDGATLVAAAGQNDPANPYAGMPGGSTPPPAQGYGAAPGYQPPPPPGMYPPPPPGGPQAANNTDKFRPALMGGLALGLLSSIPFINLGNILCCMWVVLGGALATYLYIKKSPTPVQIGEGAMLGAIAGAIGSVFTIFVGIPLGILAGNPLAKMMLEWAAKMNPEQGEQALRQYERMTNAPFFDQLAAALTPFLLVTVIVYVIFATLGGLVAVPLFEKRKAQQSAPPLPPPDFGGGGGYR